jgi:hypothetical protein
MAYVDVPPSNPRTSYGLVWDSVGLEWVRAQQSSGSGGGAVTVADGADVAQGTTTDAEAAAGNGSVIALLKRLRTLLSGSLAVTGTFWQATQPVSGPLTDTQLRASAVPVSGTFFQVTQPVSGAFFQVTQPVSFTQQALPANQSVNVAQVAGVSPSLNTGVRDAGTRRVTIATNDLVPVSGTFWQATQPVSGTFWQATQPVSGTFWQATQPVSFTPPTLTKGTQGATGYSTQDLKDAGRNVTNYFMAAGVAGTNAEVMQSLTGYKSGAAVTATATPAVVTSGKTYRITQITLSYQSLASAGACLFRLRANLSGTGAVGSPLVMNWVIGSAAAVAGITTTLDIPFPDGLEFAAGTGIAVGMLGLSTVGAALAAGFGTITIYGYEY